MSSLEPACFFKPDLGMHTAVGPFQFFRSPSGRLPPSARRAQSSQLPVKRELAVREVQYPSVIWGRILFSLDCQFGHTLSFRFFFLFLCCLTFLLSLRS